ncbi:MAG: dTDP-4-dehydrorhamnose 3,5-epimerase [Deltaproteobacteria bacterium]|nr:dTDP-4-dehydrorhamnose 3,5-epimerase [Deltaproteobacteria bacterium]
MRVSPSSIPEVLIIEPDVFRDNRGFFTETYHEERYGRFGITSRFVQDNLSFSVRGTLRGLHYQYPRAQAKLISVLQGEVLDVAVDIRKGSPSFGKWTGIELSAESMRQAYIPEGFAHGFCVLSQTAVILYKCTDFYAPQTERGLLWCDPDLGIEWPVRDPILSGKDGNYPCLKDIPPEHLPVAKEDEP